MERTFAIIKPDAFGAGNAGKIIARIYEEGFTIVGLKKLYLSKVEAKGFYYVHEGKPFYESLTDFMSSGPIVVMVLEGEKVIERYRKLMGATNFKDAEEGTIRREFATDIEKNVVHGSDSPESAAFEMGYFFNRFEIIG